eukprot:TRINITY_DN1831_c0_g1_i1.p3 TRINITY_DN1831_c0_g1~~TRINITY_DN1831_c0_g1_i1.p3  ORF type:complete len:133 (-),score=33.92 TRINITY_DN1831_c0_g1_i1:264-662(-)
MLLGKVAASSLAVAAVDRTSSTAAELQVLTMLLEAGVIVDLPNKQGRTALHEASFSLKEDIAVALVRAGAALNLIDAQSRTPLDKVVASGDRQSDPLADHSVQLQLQNSLLGAVTQPPIDAQREGNQPLPDV